VTAQRYPTGEPTQRLNASRQPANDRQLREGPPAPAVATTAEASSRSRGEVRTGGFFGAADGPRKTIRAVQADNDERATTQGRSPSRKNQVESKSADAANRAPSAASDYFVAWDLAAHSHDECVVFGIKHASTNDQTTALEYFDQRGIR
jgi:hypothetical protein